MSLSLAPLLSLVGAAFCIVGFAWNRQWRLSLASAFSMAYTVFDKVWPNIIPAPVVDSFAWVFAGLVLLELVRKFPRAGKRPAGQGS